MTSIFTNSTTNSRRLGVSKGSCEEEKKKTEELSSIELIS